MRRTLAYNFQQFHLPSHLRFVTLDLFSQDSHCDPTAEPLSNICSELHMYHLCACLENLYRSASSQPDGEVKECTRKHPGSELSGQKSAELLDARHVRRLVRERRTLANASRVKMPGMRAAEQHQRRRRNVELEIRTHDRWTRVRVQLIP